MHKSNRLLWTCLVLLVCTLGLVAPAQAQIPVPAKPTVSVRANWDSFYDSGYLDIQFGRVAYAYGYHIWVNGNLYAHVTCDGYSTHYNYYINGTVPNSEYVVRVSAYNPTGEGPESDPVKAYGHSGVTWNAFYHYTDNSGTPLVGYY